MTMIFGPDKDKIKRFERQAARSSAAKQAARVVADLSIQRQGNEAGSDGNVQVPKETV